MLCEVRSLGLSGISGYEVRAECDLSAGLPAFEIVFSLFSRRHFNVRRWNSP